MTNDEFYNRINQVCKQTGLTKTEIAKRCGFDRKVLMKKGEILMGVYNFARFCEVTHADANWILGLKESEAEDENNSFAQHH